ncbi:hypothetical protein J3F84DRAFT_380951 [Trichoderma pleuroticola]
MIAEPERPIHICQYSLFHWEQSGHLPLITLSSNIPTLTSPQYQLLMSDAMSITPISRSEPWDFQAQGFSWMEGQYVEIGFIQFDDTALKSTSALGFGGESWSQGQTSTGFNAAANIPPPATSRPSAKEKTSRESCNSDDAVDTTRAATNAPRKRPGGYKNAPAHVLNRRREQCRVAQQKHCERKDVYYLFIYFIINIH